MQNIEPLLGEKKQQEREERQIHTVNSRCYVLPAMPKGRAHTMLGPIKSLCKLTLSDIMTHLPMGDVSLPIIIQYFRSNTIAKLVAVLHWNCAD
jgi:hypothetical protein